MSKHTPGPWRAQFREVTSAVASDGRVASLSQLNRVRRREPDEVAANARLIAAAPDMLEALEDARDWCLDDDGGDYWPYKAIIEAIDKATGSET